MAAEDKEQEKIQDLKKHLADLQDKIADLEGSHKKPFEVKLLYSWKSPARIYRKKSKRWAINLLLLVLIILVVLLFLQQLILMATVLTFGAFLYLLDAVPPDEIEHQITNEGMNTTSQSYLWEELYDFWFTDKGEYTQLNIDTNLNFPRRLLMLVKKDEVPKVKEVLVQFLPFREKVEHSWYEKASDKLATEIHHLVGS